MPNVDVVPVYLVLRTRVEGEGVARIAVDGPAPACAFDGLAGKIERQFLADSFRFGCVICHGIHRSTYRGPAPTRDAAALLVR